MTLAMTGAQLRAHEARVAGMLADPYLVGELLLVGLVWARCVDLGDPPMASVVRDTARLVYARAEHGPHLHRWRYEEHYPRVSAGGVARVKDVLRSDIRRYAPDLARAYFCQRPVRGRAEARERCGRSAHGSGRYLFVDLVDGTRCALGHCSQPRCKAWWEALRADNEARVAATTPPEPVANRGGVLAGHLDELDWPHLWSHLDPSWRPPHEAPGWRPPKLRIVVNDEPETPAVTASPALTVLKGGWR